MKNSIYLLLAIVIIACNMNTTTTENKNSLNLDASKFDTTINGKAIKLFELTNENGIKVYLTNYGARIVGIQTPDKNGKFTDIVLGYSTIDEYLNDPVYMGCIVGRFANRINEAKFTLEGNEYSLFKNDGDNTLHGGHQGLDRKIWDAEMKGDTLIFSYISPDGEEGYPGNLSMKKQLSLNGVDELAIDYFAETDKVTVINLSNHAYWNLKGEGDSTILDHMLKINADFYTPVDNEWIPFGDLVSVVGTPFDFTLGKSIGEEISTDHDQLSFGLGYDHNWVLNRDSVNKITFAAKLWEESTGRYVKFMTTEPGMQFYSGNFLKGNLVGKSGRPYNYRSSLVIETQHFPDSPNHDNFPSTILKPGEVYEQHTIYKFGIIDE